MVSLPAYDPNSVASPKTYDKLNNPHNVAAQLVNRATQSQYPPGSTMKVVTAAAGLDSGDFTPSSTINAPATIEVSGAPLSNDDGQPYGEINMATALTNSVNTFFAQVGEKVGIPTMVEYMKRFGFYSDPKLDLPDTDMTATGPRNSAGDLVTEGFDVGRVAIGQGGAEGQMLATPLQMAEVAATVANDGALMKPSLVQKVTDPDGRTVSELKPSVQSQAIKPETAKELNSMMVQVTQEGTAAGLTVAGAPFAGKTGTAEINIPNSVNQPWFIGFAPANDPKIAVAVTLERCTSCFGGTVAGPVATKVMETALLAAGQ
jgi:peptidoglycan glycosyltransferase